MTAFRISGAAAFPPAGTATGCGRRAGRAAAPRRRTADGRVPSPPCITSRRTPGISAGTLQRCGARSTQRPGRRPSSSLSEGSGGVERRRLCVGTRTVCRRVTRLDGCPPSLDPPARDIFFPSQHPVGEVPRPPRGSAVSLPMPCAARPLAPRVAPCWSVGGFGLAAACAGTGPRAQLPACPRNTIRSTGCTASRTPPPPDSSTAGLYFPSRLRSSATRACVFSECSRPQPITPRPTRTKTLSPDVDHLHQTPRSVSDKPWIPRRSVGSTATGCPTLALALMGAHVDAIDPLLTSSSEMSSARVRATR